MIEIFDLWARRRSETALGLMAAALIAGIGALDYLTGYELSFGLFYLLPITFVGWYGSRRSGVFASIGSGIVWLIAGALSAPRGTVPAPVLLWNSGIRLGFFLIVALLTASLRRALLRETALARTDPLTGLSNSRSFREDAQLELRRAERLGYVVSVVYIDLDNFKAVNDNDGHHAGDALLKTLASAMRAALRETDLFGRMGGDEFAMLLPNTDSAGAAIVVRKLMETIREAAKSTPYPVTMSVGVIHCSAPMPAVDALIGAADALMYEAKAAGKNTTRFGAMGRPA